VISHNEGGAAIPHSPHWGPGWIEKIPSGTSSCCCSPSRHIGQKEGKFLSCWCHCHSIPDVWILCKPNVFHPVVLTKDPVSWLLGTAIPGVRDDTVLESLARQVQHNTSRGLRWVPVWPTFWCLSTNSLISSLLPFILAWSLVDMPRSRSPITLCCYSISPRSWNKKTETRHWKILFLKLEAWIWPYILLSFYQVLFMS
jgi:hypothetical protein